MVHVKEQTVTTCGLGWGMNSSGNTNVNRAKRGCALTARLEHLSLETQLRRNIRNSLHLQKRCFTLLLPEA